MPADSSPARHSSTGLERLPRLSARARGVRPARQACVQPVRRRFGPQAVAAGQAGLEQMYVAARSCRGACSHGGAWKEITATGDRGLAVVSAVSMRPAQILSAACRLRPCGAVTAWALPRRWRRHNPGRRIYPNPKPTTGAAPRTAHVVEREQRVRQVLHDRQRAQHAPRLQLRQLVPQRRVAALGLLALLPAHRRRLAAHGSSHHHVAASQARNTRAPQRQATAAATGGLP